mmetsp:Transcript_9726/g.27292  ORF Transcript_9726/g.27292 Transcript_9726/m.27292 type:complete len:203 (+) Transcript_9726:2-610(+)
MPRSRGPALLLAGPGGGAVRRRVRSRGAGMGPPLRGDPAPARDGHGPQVGRLLRVIPRAVHQHGALQLPRHGQAGAPGVHRSLRLRRRGGVPAAVGGGRGPPGEGGPGGERRGALPPPQHGVHGTGRHGRRVAAPGPGGGPHAREPPVPDVRARCAGQLLHRPVVLLAPRGAPGRRTAVDECSLHPRRVGLAELRGSAAHGV